MMTMDAEKSRDNQRAYRRRKTTLMALQDEDSEGPLPEYFPVRM